MSDEPAGFGDDFFVAPGERDPVRAARDAARPLPRRFYSEATAAPAEGGFALLLDGRTVRTPGKRGIIVPSRPLADALAAEWAGQGEAIDPSTMPLTRIVNAALDGVATHMAEVEADTIKYAASDLICYRAAEPESSCCGARRGVGPSSRLCARGAWRPARPRRGGHFCRTARLGHRRAGDGGPGTGRRRG